jgi:hypothetical protein
VRGVLHNGSGGFGRIAIFHKLSMCARQCLKYCNSRENTAAPTSICARQRAHCKFANLRPSCQFIDVVPRHPLPHKFSARKRTTSRELREVHSCGPLSLCGPEFVAHSNVSRVRDSKVLTRNYAQLPSESNSAWCTFSCIPPSPPLGLALDESRTCACGFHAACPPINNQLIIFEMKGFGFECVVPQAI